MEGLEDNTIKQTNSCYNKSKKKKVIIIVIAILCVAAVIGFVITKVVTTPKVEIDYGTSDIYTQKDMDEAIKVIKRKTWLSVPPLYVIIGRILITANPIRPGGSTERHEIPP